MLADDELANRAAPSLGALSESVLRKHRHAGRADGAKSVTPDGAVTQIGEGRDFAEPAHPPWRANEAVIVVAVLIGAAAAVAGHGDHAGLRASVDQGESTASDATVGARFLTQRVSPAALTPPRQSHPRSR